MELKMYFVTSASCLVVYLLLQLGNKIVRDWRQGNGPEYYDFRITQGGDGAYYIEYRTENTTGDWATLSIEEFTASLIGVPPISSKSFGDLQSALDMINSPFLQKYVSNKEEKRQQVWPKV